jgi:hypothetical protein
MMTEAEWGERPYDAPSKHGLTKVGELDFSSGSYEFDITVVFWDGKQLLWADDSGCSCPSPFEGFDDVAAFEHGDSKRLREHLLKRGFNQYSQYVTHEQVDDLLKKARGLEKEAQS